MSNDNASADWLVTLEHAAALLKAGADALRWSHNVDPSNPTWDGESDAKEQHDAELASAQRLRALADLLAARPGWKHVQLDGFPPCDNETVFVGINSAGFCGCFNEHGLMSTATGQRSICLYATPEGCSEVMSDLEWWRVLDTPAREDAPHG